MDHRKGKVSDWLKHTFQPMGIAGFFAGAFLSLPLSIEIKEWMQFQKKLIVPLMLLLLVILAIIGQHEWKKNKRKGVWGGNGWLPLGIAVTSVVCSFLGYLGRSHLILAPAACGIIFLFDYILWSGREEDS